MDTERIEPAPLHNLLICCGYYEHWTGCAPRCPKRAWTERHIQPPTADGEGTQR